MSRRLVLRSEGWLVVDSRHAGAAHRQAKTCAECPPYTYAAQNPGQLSAIGVKPERPKGR